MIIENGVGNSNKALVDGNFQLHNFDVQISGAQDAVKKGNAYNINTGLIALTAATESGVLYLKNDESPVNGESGLFIDAVAIGIDDEGTTTGMTKITVIRNPTTGTLISTASAVAMNQNRNFGSPNTLSTTTLAYKGAEGHTVTDGSDIALFMQQPGTRGYYTIDMELTRGSSIAVKMDTDTSGGTTNIYAALICHRIDGKNFSA